MLPRFQELSEGQIYFDDIPVQEIELSYLRSQIATVNQQVVLFNRSVRDNIAYGQLQDSSDEQVLQLQKLLLRMTLL
jgi:subfamily B ATP-binding cassette protein MsbA